ncbi:hypothetical protein DLAC_06796 [Tieghemostelium lacteum]|uniref:DUF5898 domain-containing protein n=1 Tax=Tieghemostelium lacteum TaxID=361077 RepID=A0A151ZDE4_TIELA|nr:hypothetical protein DLAC_06796 [Tieghemostelium lacteum]|eukprot:KYQ91976.1 hypothetical protein DLAC_06796 [Tieghemostelium lacteum]
MPFIQENNTNNNGFEKKSIKTWDLRDVENWILSFNNFPEKYKLSLSKCKNVLELMNWSRDDFKQISFELADSLYLHFQSRLFLEDKEKTIFSRGLPILYPIKFEKNRVYFEKELKYLLPQCKLIERPLKDPYSGVERWPLNNNKISYTWLEKDTKSCQNFFEIFQSTQQFILDVIYSIMEEDCKHFTISCKTGISINGIDQGFIYIYRTNDFIPIGVIELDNPSDVSSKCTNYEMNSSVIHGILYEEMKRLKYDYGQRNCFGIYTTYHQWRIYSDHDNIISSLDIENDSNNNISSSSSSSSTITPIILPTTPPKQDCGVRKYSKIFETTAEKERSVYGSQVFNHNDPELAYHLRNTILKMMNSPRLDVDINNRLEFIQLTRESYKWVQFEEKPQFNFNLINHTNILKKARHLYLIEDLGKDVNGKVWLSFTNQGQVLVLKFYINNRYDRTDLQLEHRIWSNVWKLPVYIREWNHNQALMMPYVQTIAYDSPRWKDQTFINMVLKAIDKLLNHGYSHENMKRDHIGIYIGSNGHEKVLLFDLSECKRIDKSNQKLVEKKRNEMIQDLFPPDPPPAI